MHLSTTLTLTVPVISLVLLLNSVEVRSVPQQTPTTATPQLGLRGYLEEFQRINNEVTAAIISGDTEKVQQLSKRLEELRHQSEREAREAEKERRRAQEERNRLHEESKRSKSESGPTAVYFIVGIFILIAACVALMKICKSGSGSQTSPQPAYGRPEPAAVMNTFNTQTTTSGGFTLRPYEYTYMTPGGGGSNAARSRSPSPGARTPSPRHTPTPARGRDERSSFAPSAPLLNPNNDINDAPPAYEEAIRSSPRPLRHQSTEEGPPPFNPELNGSNA